MLPEFLSCVFRSSGMPGGLPPPLALQLHQPFPDAAMWGPGTGRAGLMLGSPASRAHLPQAAADSIKQNLQMSGSQGGGDFSQALKWMVTLRGCQHLTCCQEERLLVSGESRADSLKQECH